MKLKKGELTGIDGHKKKKGTKIHAVTSCCLPLSIETGAGNEHDSKKFFKVIEGIKVKGERKGRPRTRPGEVIADSAYDTEEIRGYLRARGIKGNIPKNKRGRINPKLGRPTRFDEKGYKIIERSVDRFFGWLKCGFRRLALRYEKLKITFLGLLHIACFIIAWRILR